MPPVRLITDSTADLPQDAAAGHGIGVVPLTLRFGDEEFRDGVDLSPEEFLKRLAAAEALPSTAQPAPSAFEAVYREALARDERVVSVHLSGKLSGTVNSARVAWRDLGEPPHIAVVDSLQASMALGLIVLAGARVAGRGGSMEEVLAVVRSAQQRVRLLLFCDTLEYLQRGGRIGRAAAFLGGLLSVKPLITLRNGEVYPEERVRTRARALERLTEWAEGLGAVEEFAVLHVSSLEDAEALDRGLTTRYPGALHHLAPAGPVIATHVGPGAMGVAALLSEPGDGS